MGMTQIGNISLYFFWLTIAFYVCVGFAFYFRLKYYKSETWKELGSPEIFKRSFFDKRDINKGGEIINNLIENKVYLKLNDKILILLGNILRTSKITLISFGILLILILISTGDLKFTKINF